MSIKYELQQWKHRAFLAYKPYRFPIAHRIEPLFRSIHRLMPDNFDPADWPDTHLVHDEPLLRETTEPVARRIFVFWTGPNPLTPNRERNLESIRRVNPEIDVILITPEELGDWILPEHPLHPSYDHLSFIHRADYLRAYMLNHHGGGYADIKGATAAWSGAFDRLDQSDAWMAGYRVPVRLMGTNHPNVRLEKVMRRYSEIRLGQNAYLARPQTPLTMEWCRGMDLVLDAAAERLADVPGNPRGDNPGYPLMLNAILAQVLDPLEVKYRQHLIYDERLFMDPDDYI
ncbi:MAG: hypothetical protein JSS74_03445 [Actinobacteria bacterium]|nr:hypothetical protein [Actinomycetota bacterium]